jgi:hypothetical protein
MSSTAGFSTPDAMSEFYGYGGEIIYFTYCGFDAVDAGGIFLVDVFTSANIDTNITIYWSWGGDLGTFTSGTTTIASGSNFGFGSGSGVPYEYYTFFAPNSISASSPSPSGQQYDNISYSYCY